MRVSALATVVFTLGSALLALTPMARAPSLLPRPPIGTPLRLHAPPDYRERLVRYAVVDRPDGIVRHLYVSRAAVEAVRRDEPLPVGTTIVAEAWTAARDGQGRLLRDAAGHLRPATLLPELDVRQKRADVPGRPDSWASGRFDVATGEAVNANLAECWICHQSVSGRDFVFTRRALVRFVANGRVQRRDCGRPDRQLCAGDIEQIVGRRP